MKTILLIVVAALIMALSPAADGQCQITAVEIDDGDFILASDTLMMGRDGDVLLVWERVGDTYIQRPSLEPIPPDAPPSLRMSRFDLADQTLAISMNDGGVHIFRYMPGDHTWQLEQILHDPLEQPQGIVQPGISLDGPDRIAVGEIWALNVGLSTLPGAAVIWEHDGTQWNLVHRMVREMGLNSSLFGSAVTLSGDTLAIHAGGHLHMYTLIDGSWVRQGFLDSSPHVIQDNVLAQLHGSDFLFWRFDGTSWSVFETFTLLNVPPGATPLDSFQLMGDRLLVGFSRSFGCHSNDDDDEALAILYQRSDAGEWLEVGRFLSDVDDSSRSYRFVIGRLLDDEALIVDYACIDNEQTRTMRLYTDIERTDCNTNAVSDMCEPPTCPALDRNNDGVLDSCASGALTFRVEGDGRWFEPSNWSGGRIPTAADHVVLLGPVTIDRSQIAFAASIEVLCDGELMLDNADLQAPIVLIDEDGVLSGDGSIMGDVLNRGQMHINAPGSPLRIRGRYQQALIGELRIDATAVLPDAPALVIDGAAVLAGHLRPRLNDALIQKGDTWPLISYDSVDGDFDVVEQWESDAMLITTTQRLATEYTMTADGFVQSELCDRQMLDSAIGLAAVEIDGDDAVYGRTVYQRIDNEWTPIQELDEGGVPISLDDNIMVRGCSICEHNGIRAGEAHVYIREAPGDPWMWDTTLRPPVPANDLRFGADVDVDAARIVVGRPGPISFSGEPSETPSRGAVMVYEQVDGTWMLRQQIDTPVEEGGMRFGMQVDISGDWLMVGGIPANSFDGSSDPPVPGVLWFYQRQPDDTWQLAQSVADPDPNGGSFFGWFAAMDGDVAATTAYRGGNLMDARTHTYILRRRSGRWWIEQRFSQHPPGLGSLYLYLNNIAVDDGVVVQGLHQDQSNPGAGESGVHLFTQRHGAWQRHVTPLTAPPGDELFGVSVALDNGHLAISSETASGGGRVTFLAGAAALGCNDNGSPDQCDILAGDALDVNGDGRPDECPTSCAQDCYPLSGNGVVNIDDLLQVILDLGQPGGACDVHPVNDDGTIGDGMINVDDALSVIAAFGTCP